MNKYLQRNYNKKELYKRSSTLENCTSLQNKISTSLQHKKLSKYAYCHGKLSELNEKYQ